MDVSSPNKNEKTAEITLSLTGIDESLPKAGFQVKLRLLNFKLVGDKGQGVPTLNFEKITLRMSFHCSISIIFHAETKKWSFKTFDISIKSFKGPYGLSKR